MTTFGRWLPAITQTPIIRRAVLGAAGLAVVGGTVAGPVTAAYAAPAEHHGTRTVASARDDRGHDRHDDRRNDRRDSREREVRVRYEAQPNFYYCGPASTRIALTAMNKAFSQDKLAEKLGTTEAGTNSAVDITRVLNELTGGHEYKTREIPGKTAKPAEVKRLRADVTHAVDSGRAVVANIAGTTTDTEGVDHSYEGGHYLAVVGYRDGGDLLKISDPAKPDRSSYWVTVDDLANWMATRGYSA
ncbi:MAG TPA: C39 family peptidase [Micromonospora sp.]